MQSRGRWAQMLAQGQSSSAERGGLADVSSGQIFLKKKKIVCVKIYTHTYKDRNRNKYRCMCMHELVYTHLFPGLFWELHIYQLIASLHQRFERNTIIIPI